jgi:hypothetical protein
LQPAGVVFGEERSAAAGVLDDCADLVGVFCNRQRPGFDEVAAGVGAAGVGHLRLFPDAAAVRAEMPAGFAFRDDERGLVDLQGGSAAGLAGFALALFGGQPGG